uniref:hypothetical protein n=1 Tax=uncultured Draconibacterium sp. TaxID=1573823 RepID=UPI0032164FFC
MKKLNQFLFLFIVIVFTNCDNKYEKISIGNNISLKIPANFVINQSTSENEIVVNAKSDNDELYIAAQTISGLDTMIMEHRKEIVEKNIKGFANAIKSRNLEIEDMKTQDDLILSSFSVETETHGSLMTVYGRIVNQDSSLIILTYFTEKPTSKASLKAKDIIFKSIKTE